MVRQATDLYALGGQREIIRASFVGTHVKAITVENESATCLSIRVCGFKPKSPQIEAVSDRGENIDKITVNLVQTNIFHP